MAIQTVANLADLVGQMFRLRATQVFLDNDGDSAPEMFCIDGVALTSVAGPNLFSSLSMRDAVIAILRAESDDSEDELNDLNDGEDFARLLQLEIGPFSTKNKSKTTLSVKHRLSALCNDALTKGAREVVRAIVFILCRLYFDP